MSIPSPSSHQQLLANSFQFIYWAWCSMVWNIHLASLLQLSWLCSFTGFDGPPHCQSTGNRKVPVLKEALLSNNQNINVPPMLFPHQIQNTAPYQLLVRKLILSQPKPVQVQFTLKVRNFSWEKVLLPGDSWFSPRADFLSKDALSLAFDKFLTKCLRTHPSSFARETHI